MQTPKEMYDYCVQNNTGAYKKMNKYPKIRNFKVISEIMQSDEHAVMCFVGKKRYKKGYKKQFYSCAITNKRILIARKRIIGKIIQTVQIDNVNDITLTTGLFYGRLTIDTIKERITMYVFKRCANNINNQIHNIVQAVKDTRNIFDTSVKTTADELLKYKNLLDVGAITQEEFEVQKSKLFQ